MTVFDRPGRLDRALQLLAVAVYAVACTAAAITRRLKGAD